VASSIASGCLFSCCELALQPTAAPKTVTPKTVVAPLRAGSSGVRVEVLRTHPAGSTAARRRRLPGACAVRHRPPACDVVPGRVAPARASPAGPPRCGGQEGARLWTAYRVLTGARLIDLPHRAQRGTEVAALFYATRACRHRALDPGRYLKLAKHDRQSRSAYCPPRPPMYPSARTRERSDPAPRPLTSARGQLRETRPRLPSAF
jgi:hypothetical protein